MIKPKTMNQDAYLKTLRTLNHISTVRRIASDMTSVTMRQPQPAIYSDINNLSMWVSDTHVISVTILQQYTALLSSTMHKGIKYPCDLCDYTAITSGALKQHKQSKHEDIQ